MAGWGVVAKTYPSFSFKSTPTPLKTGTACRKTGEGVADFYKFEKIYIVGGRGKRYGQ